MNLPDDLADVERDLAARSRPEPSANLRPRVLSAVAHELSQPSTGENLSPQVLRRPRRLIVASGVAASIALAFTLWQWNGPPRPPSPPIMPHPQVLPFAPDDRLTTWRDCRQALDHSPDALDQLLELKSARRTAHSPFPRTLLHAYSELLTPSGDL